MQTFASSSRGCAAGALFVVVVLVATLASPAERAATATEPRAARAVGAPITVATFNVKARPETDRSWRKRRAELLRMVRRADADVLVLQESNAVTYRQRNGNNVGLKGPWSAGWLARRAGYRVATTLTNPDGTPYTAPNAPHLLYRPSRLQHLNVGDGYNCCSTHAVLRDRRTGQRFTVIGVHLARGKGTDADRARRWQLDRTDRIYRLAAMDGRPYPTPMLWVGDFNAPRQEHRQVRGYLKKYRQVDSITLARRRSNARLNTFNGMRRRAASSGRRIDQIWVPRGTRVRSWTQVADVRDGRYVGRFASDHNPVVATIRLPR